MATHDIANAEVIDVRPLGAAVKTSQTETLMKTDSLEVIRLVLPAGKYLPPHQAKGELLVQCLEGRVAFDADGVDHELLPGYVIHLPGGMRHAVRALEDASILATIVRR